MLLWFERKGAALIQDRIGANRASIFGLGRRLGLPNLGLVNTLLADPIKLFTKEDFVPDGADRFIHDLAPFLALFPVIITFAVVPIGDVLRVGSRTINLQAANLNVAALYILATLGMGVYGIALGGWASNNRWALLGAIRASAQMISYEIAMGLAIIAVVITYGTLDLQEICRMQGGVWFGWVPRWGILLQPASFLMLLIAGMAESKRVPFDLPEGESELIAGYFTEYSGGKQAVFMMTDFAEVVLVAALITLFFFGGWQVPWLYRDGFHFAGPQGAFLPLPNVVVAILRGHRILGESGHLLLVPDTHPLDHAAHALRPVDAPGMEGSGPAWTPQSGRDRLRRRRFRSKVMPLWLFAFLAMLAIDRRPRRDPAA